MKNRKILERKIITGFMMITRLQELIIKRLIKSKKAMTTMTMMMMMMKPHLRLVIGNLRVKEKIKKKRESQ